MSTQRQFAPQPLSDRTVFAGRVARLLDLAYQRPCFVCYRQGNCVHRELTVELAYFGLLPTATAARPQAKTRPTDSSFNEKDSSFPAPPETSRVLSGEVRDNVQLDSVSYRVKA